MARNVRIPPEPGLPREEKEPRVWLRNLTQRLYVLLRIMIDDLNLLIDGYMLYLDALPTATETTRGRMVVLQGGAGVADRLYWCQKLADDTFQWTEIT